jgi:acetylglutamate kinase
MMKKRIVIKLGGASLQNGETLSEFSKIVQGYKERNYDVVIVHGGGPAINAELLKRGIKWNFINGQRQTTSEMITVIDQVLAGTVNSGVVESLKQAGVLARGLSGARDKILFCTQLNAELGQVGSVEEVDISAILEVLSQNSTPVIAPVGFGQAIKYNINADWAATKIAIALKADKLVFLTDQDGILDRDGKPLARAVPKLIHQMINEGVISGGMCTKVLAMMAALEADVKQVRVMNGVNCSRVFTRIPVGTILSGGQRTQAKKVSHVHAS